MFFNKGWVDFFLKRVVMVGPQSMKEVTRKDKVLVNKDQDDLLFKLSEITINRTYEFEIKSSWGKLGLVVEGSSTTGSFHESTPSCLTATTKHEYVAIGIDPMVGKLLV